LSVTELMQKWWKKVFGSDYDEQIAQLMKNIASRVNALYDRDFDKAYPIGQLFLDMRDFINWMLQQPNVEKIANAEYTDTTMGIVKKNWRLRYGKTISLIGGHITTGVLAEGKSELPEGDTVIVTGRLKSKLGPYRVEKGTPGTFVKTLDIPCLVYETPSNLGHVDKLVTPVQAFKHSNVDIDSKQANFGLLTAIATPPYLDEFDLTYPTLAMLKLTDPYVNLGFNPVFKAIIKHYEEIDWSLPREQLLSQIYDYIIADIPSINKTIYICLEKVYTDSWRTNFTSAINNYISAKASVDITEADDPVDCILTNIELAEKDDILGIAGSPDPNILYRYVHLLEPASETYFKLHKASLLFFANLGDMPLCNMKRVIAEQPVYCSEIRSPARYLWSAGIVPIDSIPTTKDDYDLAAKCLVAYILYHAHDKIYSYPYHWKPIILKHLEVPAT